MSNVASPVKRDTGEMMKPVNAVSNDLDLDKNNWRVHQLYVTKEFSKCLVLIEEHLKATNKQSEYLLVVKGIQWPIFAFTFTSRAITISTTILGFTGLIRRQEGRIEEALELFQAANALNPHDISILKHIGRCLYWPSPDFAPSLALPSPSFCSIGISLASLKPRSIYMMRQKNLVPMNG